mmetsp:Transcript_25553/g.35256  ORF Transcript_25553/g.35256 Transcript_25553/m.35256 type:complete len:114 (+) Transcript_25553:196-537(+)
MNERFFCVSSELSESTECEIGFFSIRPPNGFEQLENPALSLEQLQEAFALAAKATEQDVLVKLPNLEEEEEEEEGEEEGEEEEKEGEEEEEEGKGCREQQHIHKHKQQFQGQQ